jgi:hypothetical protein
MARSASAHQAATASREGNCQQRAGRTRRTSADPQRAQPGATAAAAAEPGALDSLSRLQQLANASPQVAQLRRLQALADGRSAPVAQLAGGPEEEELVQGKFSTAQRQPQLQQAPRADNTGLPDQLKSGIESLSGLSMDHVRVHYNSSQPARVNALAYAQGSDIHLAPGQERHLPHEAWHVVQQTQGRVRPTMQMKDGVQVNDDAGLEREADVMGAKALQTQALQSAAPEEVPSFNAAASTHGQRHQEFGVNAKTPPIQCELNIDGKQYSTFKKYAETEDYESVLTWLKEQDSSIGKRGYNSTLKQYVSSPDVERFYSLDHFKQNLLYDLRQGTWTKDSNASAYIRYMTRRGWKNAALHKNTILDNHARQSISLYRTMPLDEAKKIMIDRDISKLSGHMGDYAAALDYCHRATNDRVLVEFQLNAGAHLQLFSTDNMAVVAGGTTTQHIRTRYETDDSEFVEASRGEGLHEEKVGVKSEEIGVAGFSLAAHGSVASDVLKPMIKSIRPLLMGKKDEAPAEISKSEFVLRYTD